MVRTLNAAEGTNVKHTPGPWEFVPKLTASENHRGFFVRAEKATRNGKWALAEVQPGDEDGKLGEANARLIVAAPLLLAYYRASRNLQMTLGHPDATAQDEHDAEKAYEEASNAAAVAVGAFGAA